MVVIILPGRRRNKEVGFVDFILELINFFGKGGW
jgi:hypothetical protein